jgi:large-conductance mechanosensitive channel
MSDSSAFGKIIAPIMSNIVDPIIGVMFAVGVVVFAFGVIEMIIHGDDAEARAKGRNHMMGGVLGMVVMLSAWGLIYLVSNTVRGL